MNKEDHTRAIDGKTPARKILVVALSAAYDEVPTAGGKSFNYYLSRLCESPGIEVRILAVGRRDDAEFMRMRDKYSGESIFDYIELPLLAAVFRYLYYHTDMKYFLTLLSARFSQLDFLTRKYFKRGFSRIREEQWQPDIVILEWPEMLCVFEDARSAFPSAKIIISEHDVAFQRYSRRISTNYFLRRLTEKIYKNLKQFEIKSIQNIDHVIVFSNKDKALLTQEGIDSRKISQISLYYFRFDKREYGQTKNILFWGAMTRPENIEAVNWFTREVFHNLKKEIKDINLFVVGGGGKSHLARIQKQDGVIITGFVPDPGPYFDDSFCLVAPLSHGAGIKVKVMEAMAAGLPVLTGRVGIEGIDGEDNVNYLHCEKPDDYSAAIRNLLSNPSLARQIGDNAKKHILSVFNYERDFEKYYDLLTTC